jgi:hypothetical protein
MSPFRRNNLLRDQDPDDEIMQPSFALHLYFRLSVFIARYQRETGKGKLETLQSFFFAGFGQEIVGIFPDYLVQQPNGLWS